MARWAVIKSNYVIDVVVWDGVTPWQYPGSYDLLIEENTENVGYGDWYEASEEIFYRPLTTPPDFPPTP
jgi:hypothetical protein